MAMPGGALRQPSDLHINTALTFVSVAFLQGNDDYVADKVFPLINSQKQSDIFWRYPIGTFYRESVEPRSPGAEPPRISWKPTKDSFLCENFDLAEDIFDDELANADSEFDLDATATIQLTQQHRLYRERQWAERFFAPGSWNTDLQGVPGAPGTSTQFQQWDQPGSDPITQIQTLNLDMHEKTGLAPNTLVLAPRSVPALANHPLILDRIKYTGVATATNFQFGGGISDKPLLRILSELFDIPRILVAKAVINTSNQRYDDDPSADPNATGMGHLFGRSALLTYAAPNPGKRIPTGGYTFSWSGYTGTSGIRFIKDRSVIRRCNTIVAEQSFSHQIVCPDLGVFLEDCVGA